MNDPWSADSDQNQIQLNNWLLLLQAHQLQLQLQDVPVITSAEVQRAIATSETNFRVIITPLVCLQKATLRRS